MFRNIRQAGCSLLGQLRLALGEQCHLPPQLRHLGRCGLCSGLDQHLHVTGIFISDPQITQVIAIRMMLPACTTTTTRTLSGNKIPAKLKRPVSVAWPQAGHERRSKGNVTVPNECHILQQAMPQESNPSRVLKVAHQAVSICWAQSPARRGAHISGAGGCWCRVQRLHEVLGHLQARVVHVTAPSHTRMPATPISVSHHTASRLWSLTDMGQVSGVVQSWIGPSYTWQRSSPWSALRRCRSQTPTQTTRRTVTSAFCHGLLGRHLSLLRFVTASTMPWARLPAVHDTQATHSVTLPRWNNLSPVNQWAPV